MLRYTYIACLVLSVLHLLDTRVQDEDRTETVQNTNQWGKSTIMTLLVLQHARNCDTKRLTTLEYGHTFWMRDKHARRPDNSQSSPVARPVAAMQFIAPKYLLRIPYVRCLINGQKKTAIEQRVQTDITRTCCFSGPHHVIGSIKFQRVRSPAGYDPLYNTQQTGSHVWSPYFATFHRVVFVTAGMLSSLLS
jgi:hypothetical protein